MLELAGKNLEMSVPSEMGLENLGIQNSNYSLLLASEVDDVFSAETDPQYEQFLADVWVGIILTLIVLSCVCCMCSCLLYHKFQQWKRSILEARNAANLENGNADCESLPSYTIASGLPSYQEALEQLKKVKELTKVDGRGIDNAAADVWVPQTPPTPMAKLSVSELFQYYKNSNPQGVTKS